MDLNTFLKDFHPHQPLLVLITGASGAGKTFLAKALEKSLSSEFVDITFFDSIGVPSSYEMIKNYGSPERWQEEMTHQWIERLSRRDKKVIILEGQFNPQFAIDACQRQSVQDYLLINIYADRSIRNYRLTQLRAQPHLANATMDNWAEVLKEKTQALGGHIVDNSSADINVCLNKIIQLIKGKTSKGKGEKNFL